MIGCDLGRLLVIASIPVVGVTIGISYPQLVVTCFIHATLSVFFALAERAALPQVVDPEKLPAAVAQNQATMQGAVMVGAPVAGVLYGLAHLLPFVADAVSYVISLITLRRIRISLPAPPLANRDRLLHDIAAGARFVWSDRCLRALSLISAALSPLVAGLPLVVIVLATHLGATSSQIGTILGFGGVGGLLGSALAPYLVRTVAAGTLNLAGLWLWAAFILTMGMVNTPVLLGLICAALAMLTPVLAVVAQTRRVRLVPHHLLGRVYSIGQLIGAGTAPLGWLLAGFLLSSVGPSDTPIILGSGLVLLALAATASPTMRHADLPQMPAVAGPTGSGSSSSSAATAPQHRTGQVCGGAIDDRANAIRAGR
jgi:predicted MFS family arabinose efflux permease